MSQLMHLSALLAIDTAFTLYMGKVMGSSTDVKMFPTAQTLHAVTYKLLSKAERNFAEKSVDAEGRWADVPKGMGSIWNLADTLAIANYCTDHMKDIKLPSTQNAMQYAYSLVIKSRESTKQNPKKLCDVHVIPALFDGEHIDDYPREVLIWVDRRFQYVMPPILKYLKEQGVPAPKAENITVAEWGELIDASFATMDVKAELAKDDEGGEMESFSQMTDNEIEIDLMATGGDEHIELFSSDFTGTYYLQDDENVAAAKKAQKILKGYWDLFGTCKTQAVKARQSFLNDVSTGIKEFKDQIQDQNTGAGIVIID